MEFYRGLSLSPHHDSKSAAVIKCETDSDLTRVHFVHGDITALQENAQFDAALAILVAHSIPLRSKGILLYQYFPIVLKAQAILLQL